MFSQRATSLGPEHSVVAPEPRPTPGTCRVILGCLLSSGDDRGRGARLLHKLLPYSSGFVLCRVRLPVAFGLGPKLIFLATKTSLWYNPESMRGEFLRECWSQEGEEQEHSLNVAGQVGALLDVGRLRTEADRARAAALFSLGRGGAISGHVGLAVGCCREPC
jgi:hypothetical protein